MRNLTAILTVFSVSWMGACIGGCSGASGDSGELFNEPSADASTSETFGFNADAGGADGFIAATGTCRTDTECNDGDECTVDVCERGEGEFTTGLCGHAPTTCRDDKERRDGGTTKPPPDTTLPPPVDTTCEPGCVASKKTFPPAVALTSTAPATCTKGFEINNPKSGTTYTIKRVKGTGTVPLEVQFATYLAPDHIKLVGITATGEYPLVDTCTVQTANYVDPTKGCVRPPDDSIRQYAVTLRAGTTAIRADFTGVCTPVYLRVRGLCDFEITPFTTDCKFRPVP